MKGFSFGLFAYGNLCPLKVAVAAYNVLEWPLM